MSYFSWFDYREQDRQKMLDIIKLFDQQEARDELGIGSIRDALADMLFPGTSTIQTRTRYFLFIPWMYRELERKRVNSAEIHKRARREEVTLINTLLSPDNVDTDGVIGRRARQSLQRLPSNIYWAGLNRWGILQTPSSQAQYHTNLDHFYRIQQRRESDTAIPRNWHATLPPAPSDFPKVASFALTADESSYLRERIMTSAGDSLLAFLVQRDVDEVEGDFAWQIPCHHALADEHQQQLHHARLFSSTMHGAALLYNLMLAEAVQNEELIASYKKLLEEWAKSCDSAEIRAWDRPRFWNIVQRVNPRIRSTSIQFVDSWIDLLNTHAPTEITNIEAARTLIKDREYRLKRQKARLYNPRARENWSGASGSEQLAFRWGQVKRIVGDILAGGASDA